MAADISALKRHILRRYAQDQITLFEIEAIADKAAAASMTGAATVEITSSGFDGANSSGVLVVGTNDILRACHDVLESISPVEDTSPPRQMFVPVDFSTAIPFRQTIL